jgi:hypothetical protein
LKRALKAYALCEAPPNARIAARAANSTGDFLGVRAIARSVTMAYDYIGDEVCGKFMLSGELLDALTMAADKGDSPVFVAPFLTTETEEGFASLLDKLQCSVAVAVNDLGALSLVLESKHAPVIGRLLTRQNTDPAIFGFMTPQRDRAVYDRGMPALLKYAPPPEALMNHFRDISLFCGALFELFPALKPPVRVMLDKPPHGLPKSVPDEFMPVYRNDDVLVSVLPCSDCESCPREEVFLGKTRAGVDLFRKRGVCYYKNREN